jgi:hypothetical protein
MTDYVVQAQELNTRFAQRVFGIWINASRRQTELSQTMVQRLYGKAEDQGDAFQGLLDEWVNGSAGFFAPFGLYREGLENVTRNVSQMPAVMTQVATGRAVNGGLPIEGYAALNAGETPAGWTASPRRSSRGFATTRSATRTATPSSSSSTAR